MTTKFRKLLPEEEQFVKRLLIASPNLRLIVDDLEKYDVLEADDGGMGGLIFCYNGVKPQGKFSLVVSAEFSDRDGVKVDSNLTVGEDGKLFELDMWKIDFSEISGFPDQDTKINIRV